MRRRDLIRVGGALTVGGVLAACTEEPPLPEESSPQEPSSTEEGSPTEEEGAAPAPEDQSALDEAGVAAGHPLAVDAGIDILGQGGNAVDAAIAAALADSVLQPEASGIGGGGSAIIAGPDVLDYVDYRDEVNTGGEIPDSMIGVPGLVAGLGEMHERFGVLEWGALLEPAIALARDGAPVSDYLALRLESLQVDASVAPQFFTEDGSTLEAGDQLVQAELAEVLRILADEGTEGFYGGEIAAGLAETPGLDIESLAAYAGQWSAPPEGPVGEHVMVSASPALVGPAIIQHLQIAEAFGIESAEPDSAEYFDIHAQAWRHAHHTMHTRLGDPRFVDVPAEELTDPEANVQLAREEPPHPSGSDGAGDDSAGDGNTTHISVVDRDGLTVSMTNTIMNFWGSDTYHRGFFLNDALRRFETFGGPDYNVPRPGARSIGWSAPSLLLDGERRPALALGLPGGRQIPSAIATVSSLWALHGFTVEEAVLAPRFELLETGVLRLEDPELAEPMEELGYPVEVPQTQETFGSVQAIAVDWSSRTLAGHADPRRGAGVEITA